MKCLSVLLMTCLVFSTMAQSKKKQIEMLTVSKDSIQSLLDKEREAHVLSKTTLTNQIAELNKEISDLNSKSETQNARIANLESQLKKLETQVQIKEQENLTQKNMMDNLQSELKKKTDSLLMLEAELMTYKPKPAPKKPEVVDDIKSGFKTVSIGSQIWMVENLNVATFRNGDPIPHAQTDEEWKAAGKNQQPAWCYYDNDPANGKKYGKLYNWYAVNDPRGLAPAGWHVPSDEEWTQLTDYLGGSEKAGAKMKSKNGWANDGIAGSGTNSSGFSGLPGGGRGHSGSFNYFGNVGYWWCSPENDTTNARIRLLSYDGGYVGRNLHVSSDGLSVRCLRD